MCKLLISPFCVGISMRIRFKAPPRTKQPPLLIFILVLIFPPRIPASEGSANCSLVCARSPHWYYTYFALHGLARTNIRTFFTLFGPFSPRNGLHFLQQSSAAAASASAGGAAAFCHFCWSTAADDDDDDDDGLFFPLRSSRRTKKDHSSTTTTTTTKSETELLFH